METRISQWGNSQGIRIPKSFLDAIGVSINDKVDISQNDNIIMIKKHHKKTLEELFEGYEGNYDCDFCWDDPVGKEIL